MIKLKNNNNEIEIFLQSQLYYDNSLTFSEIFYYIRKVFKIYKQISDYLSLRFLISKRNYYSLCWNFLLKYLQSEEPTLRYFILHEISKNISLLPYSIDDNNMLISFINCLLNIIINEVYI